MAKAFLSHSSTDKEIVQKVAQQLGNKNCVLDEISFEPGRKTLDQIFDELDSSDVFVFFVSDKSLNSEWVKKEINRAKQNLRDDIIDRILPIIIDKNITHEDERLPKWIAKPYNLRYFPNDVIILNKIRQALKEVSFKRTKFNQEIEKNFVGRNTEIQKFEDDINNLDNWMPTYIVAYNYFEGIGRRTFLKNALRKYELVDYLSTPTVVTIDAKESLENFIYKLNNISKNREIIEYDFSSETVENKIEIAISLVKQFVDFKELIFIVDEGGIILPNNSIVDWFTQIAENEIFENNLVFCLISKYRPNEVFIKRRKKALVYRIPELSKAETKNLFQRLLKIYKLDGIRKEDKEFFLEHLNGIPSQIIYAVNLIELNPINAKREITDITEFFDGYSKIVINHLKETPNAYQLAVFLASDEIFSIDLINKIFGDGKDTANALQKLYDLSLINFVFGGYECVKLNPTLADYINRSKITLDENYNIKINEITKKLLKEDLDEIILNDYSEFMITLKKMLEDEVKIPKKYFMPSLIIKNVIKQYDKGNYDYVIRICLELLENENYDKQIIWETYYRLTLAYARTKNDKFFDYISYFKNDINNLDYYFLLGFYHRHKGNKDRALKYYFDALDVYPDHPRSKREIVNIYLSLGEYSKALNLARENYEKRKTNIYHIHSYFVCLINNEIDANVIEILEKLISAVDSSSDVKAEDIHRCMLGQYAYYVEGNFAKANIILLEAINLNSNNNYPKKLLLEIYRNNGLDKAYSELQENEGFIYNGEDEDEF